MPVCNSMGMFMHSITLKQQNTAGQKFHCSLFMSCFLFDWSEPSPKALPKKQ